MKIILSKDVLNLGEEGDIREVAPGYARNYLIPQGFGVTYSKQNIALLEGRKKAIEKRKSEKKDQAKGLKDRIQALEMKIQMTVGDNGRLFGSVTNSMIAEELSKLGIEVERKRIEIPEHTIKIVGNFVVKVKLYGNEVASLKVSVAGPKGEQATEPHASAASATGPQVEPAAHATEMETEVSAEAADDQASAEDSAAEDNSGAEDEAAEDEESSDKE
ncbi:MAG TPA: 50S ribosomal protein L9 [Spirochaetia bacterium]|nr:50S ribosomal protein L9 [Spirochaetia bacterium]